MGGNICDRKIYDREDHTQIQDTKAKKKDATGRRGGGGYYTLVALVVQRTSDFHKLCVRVRRTKQNTMNTQGGGRGGGVITKNQTHYTSNGTHVCAPSPPPSHTQQIIMDTRTYSKKKGRPFRPCVLFAAHPLPLPSPLFLVTRTTTLPLPLPQSPRPPPPDTTRITLTLWRTASHSSTY